MLSDPRVTFITRIRKAIDLKISENFIRIIYAYSLWSHSWFPKSLQYLGYLTKYITILSFAASLLGFLFTGGHLEGRNNYLHEHFSGVTLIMSYIMFWPMSPAAGILGHPIAYPYTLLFAQEVPWNQNMLYLTLGLAFKTFSTKLLEPTVRC